MGGAHRNRKTSERLRRPPSGRHAALVASNGGAPPSTDPGQPRREAHPFHTWEMIQAQPEAVRVVFRAGARIFGEALEFVRWAPRIVVTGCGTAYHGAMVVAAALRTAKLPAEAAPAFEIGRGSFAPGKGECLIALSHSGRTLPTREAVRAARLSGACTIALSPNEGAPIREDAEHFVRLPAGTEASRCHTVSYAAAGEAGLVLAAACGGPEDPEALPDLLRDTIATADPIARELAGEERPLLLAAGGACEAAALEGALKVREAAGQVAEGYELEQAVHGPQLACEEGWLAGVCAHGASLARARMVLAGLRVLGLRTVAVASGAEEDGVGADLVLRLPAAPAATSAILHTVPWQLLAYHRAVARGRNPDLIGYDEPRVWAARGHLFPDGWH
ncbi:MAG: SIS domain-containing protein [Planctomycetales bacterium]|nr:SIS domain-containing protein [Planctomycetales bacterium]